MLIFCKEQSMHLLIPYFSDVPISQIWLLTGFRSMELWKLLKWKNSRKIGMSIWVGIIDIHHISDIYLIHLAHVSILIKNVLSIFLSSHHIHAGWYIGWYWAWLESSRHSWTSFSTGFLSTTPWRQSSLCGLCIPSMKELLWSTTSSWETKCRQTCSMWTERWSMPLWRTWPKWWWTRMPRWIRAKRTKISAVLGVLGAGCVIGSVLLVRLKGEPRQDIHHRMLYYIMEEKLLWFLKYLFISEIDRA